MVTKRIKSNSEIITDAPVDNHGKGEAFSPTDLVATSLGSCILTVIGEKAQQSNIDVKNISADITKIMQSNPRRISEIHVEIHLKENNFSEKDRKILIQTAKTCPVALSLNKEIKQVLSFNF